MFPFTRAAITLPILLTLTACATLKSSDADKATYHESSFDDKNRAPASFAPAIVAQDGHAKLDPLFMRTQADYYFAMGESYSLDGNPSKAIEAFKMTLIYDQASPAVHMRLAAEYLKQGLINESLAQAEEAVTKDPKNIDAHLLMGGLYSSMKMYPKALDSYFMVMKLRPENTEAPLYIGALYSEQKQYDKAVKYFQSLAKNADYATPHLAHYYIGRVRMEQAGAKFHKEAEASLKKALQLKPDFVDALLALGNLYSKQNKEAQALAMYKEFQKENTPNARVAEILAHTFLSKGHLEEAYEQLQVVEAESDEPMNVRVKMAMILVEQKKYDQAAQKLEEVLREVPESDKVRFYLAAVYEEMRSTEKSVREYRKIPAASSFYGEAVVHAAYLLKGMGKLDEALSLAAQGLKERADQPNIYAMYASMLDEKNDVKGALQILDQGLKKFPDNVQLRFYMGTMNDRIGNKDVVVREMKRVLELDPKHVQGMNYLAFTWAEMGEQLHEAEVLARRALELDPKDEYIMDTLGWILFKQNKIDDSIKYLEAANRNNSNVSVIAEHLGDAYMKKSMPEKAKKMYRKAAELETDRKKIEELQSKIFAIEKQEVAKPRLPANSSDETPVADSAIRK